MDFVAVQAAILVAPEVPSIQCLESVGSPRCALPEVLFQSPHAYVDEVSSPTDDVAENTCVDPEDVRFS